MASAVTLTGPLLSHKAAAGAVAAEGGLSRPKRALDGRMKRRVTPGAEHALEKEDVSEKAKDSDVIKTSERDSSGGADKEVKLELAVETHNVAMTGFI